MEFETSETFGAERGGVYWYSRLYFLTGGRDCSVLTWSIFFPNTFPQLNRFPPPFHQWLPWTTGQPIASTTVTSPDWRQTKSKKRSWRQNIHSSLDGFQRHCYKFRNDYFHFFVFCFFLFTISSTFEKNVKHAIDLLEISIAIQSRVSFSVGLTNDHFFFFSILLLSPFLLFLRSFVRSFSQLLH